MSSSAAPDVQNPAVQRTSCRGCKAQKSFVSAIKLGNQVVSGFFQAGAPQNPRVPLNLLVCSQCGLVQGEYTTPSEILYKHFWYRSSITETMRKHLQGIAEEGAREAHLVHGDSVLDIGANDGTGLSFFPKGVRRVGIEPALNLRDDCAKHADEVITALFPTSQLGADRFQVITAIAMFYDVDDPISFLRSIHSHLTSTGVFIVQMNYLNTMIRDNAFDNIGHEHLTYFNMTTLNELLHEAGLVAYKVSLNSLNGGSFRVFCRRDDSVESKQDDSVARLMQEEQQSKIGSLVSLQDMERRIENIRSRIMAFLRGRPSVWVCGASTRGNTLLQYFNLTSEHIVAAGERDPHKFGLVTPGTNIPIRDEKDMRQEGKMLLVLPWAFKNEIVAREQDYILKGGELLFPLPEPVVISAKGTRSLL